MVVDCQMNNVYMQTTEQRNFMRVLRQLLGLEDGAGVNACLARIRSMLDKVTHPVFKICFGALLVSKDLYWNGRSLFKSEEMRILGAGACIG